MSWYDEMIANGQTINEQNARNFSYQQLQELQQSGIDVRPLLNGTSMYRTGSAADYGQEGMNPQEFAAAEAANRASAQNYLSHVQGLEGPNSRAQYSLNPDGSIRTLNQAVPESKYGKLNRFALVAGAGAAASYAGGAGQAGAAPGSISSEAAAGEIAAGGAGQAGSAGGAAGSAAPVAQVGGAGGIPTVASGGSALGTVGSFLNDNASTIGGIVGGIGSYLDARNQPDTLTSTTTNTTTNGVDPRYQPVVDNYLSAVQGQSPSNPYLDRGQLAIGGAAKDQSLLNGAIATHGQFLQNGGQNQYAGPNPYLEAQIQQGMKGITQQGQQIGQANDAMMARNNAFGGSAWRQMQAANTEATGNAAANYQNNMRFNDYQMQAGLDESRLGRQQNAYMAAPGLDQARYTAGNQLINSGQQQFNNAQTVLNNQGNAAGLVGQIGNTQTSTNTQTSNNPYQQNPYAALLGGTLAGAQIGGQLRR